MREYIGGVFMAAGKIVSVSYWPAPLAYFEDLPKSKATYKELTAAMKEAAIHIRDSHPQTIVILSRYRYTLRDAIGYSPQPRLRGALQPSGGAPITLGMETDDFFNHVMLRLGERMGIPLVSILDHMPTISTDDYFLHHTAAIPLHFLGEEGLGNKQIVRLTMGRLSYEELYTFGRLMQMAAQQSGRRIAVVGSANLVPARLVNQEDVSVDKNIALMNALADCRPQALHELGYPVEDEYAFRTAAFVLGAVSGLKAAVQTHHYSTISGQSYGLVQYAIP